MPEGHTLHALARDLTAAFVGTEPQVSSPQGRFSDGAALLDGQQVERAWAHGKLLFVAFEGERVLHIHLGLIGKLDVRTVQGAAVPPAVGAVRVRLLTDEHLADLRGAITCTVLDPDEVRALVARQGPDPLQPGADPEPAWQRIHRSRTSVGELLMDQTVIAGIGNVYRCEVLHRHRVNPAFAGSRIKRRTFDAIWADLVRLMPVGVRSGRIVTLEHDLAEVEAALAAGRPVDPTRRYAVYKRTGLPCPRCGGTVRTRMVAGRNLFWCAACQRRT